MALFLCIPLSIGSLYLLQLGIRAVLIKIFSKRKHLDDRSKNTFSNIIATAMVIYWAIGISSFNVIYLLNIHLSSVSPFTPLSLWLIVLCLAFVLACVYGFFSIRKYLRNL